MSYAFVRGDNCFLQFYHNKPYLISLFILNLFVEIPIVYFNIHGTDPQKAWGQRPNVRHFYTMVVTGKPDLED